MGFILRTLLWQINDDDDEHQISLFKAKRQQLTVIPR